jgi:hypothetical protein
MPYRAALVGILALATACSLPRGVLGGDGSVGLDAVIATTDVGPADAPRQDGEAEDAFTLGDAYVEDGASVSDDASVEDDAFTPDDAFVRDPSCTELYEALAPDFELCSGELAADCVFFSRLGERSCGSVCGDRCVRSYDNSITDVCGERGSAGTCEDTYFGGICHCARRP